MSFVENWVETDPDGSVITVSVLDDWIRKTKLATRERMEGDAALNLTGLIDAGTWSTGPVPKAGSARASVVAAANLGTVPLQDGRMAITSDTQRLYHMKGTGYVELAYAPLTGATFTGAVTFNAGIVGTLSTAAQSTITSLGTLTLLNVSGAVTLTSSVTVDAGTSRWDLVRTGLYPSLDYNAAAGNTFRFLTAAAAVAPVLMGALTASTISGTLQTAAQGNITSVGQLTALSISGDVTFTAMGKLLRSLKGILGDGTAFVINNAANTVNNLSMTDAGVATFISTVIAIGFTGPLTGNVTGNLTGTILTAAQGNITSVGTLTSLTVTGLITANGGLTVIGAFGGLTATTLGGPGSQATLTANVAGAGSPVATAAQAKWLPITGSDALVYYVPAWR